MAIWKEICRELQDQIKSGKYESIIWTSRGLRKRIALTGWDISRLEKKGVISKARRNKKGWLVWTSPELDKMLEQIKFYLDSIPAYEKALLLSGRKRIRNYWRGICKV